MRQKTEERLIRSEERYAEIEMRLSDPAVSGKTEIYRSLLKEYGDLTPLVEAYRSFKAASEEFVHACHLAEDKDADEELRALAREEADTQKDRTKLLEEQLEELLLPKDPNDGKDVIIEIRGCAGGEEAALFAADLYRMYSMFAAQSGFRTELLFANETELGGYKEIDFQVTGNGVYSRFKFESGVHRVQRVPTTESQGKIQTSTATVAVLPVAEEVEVALNPADIVMETCKSSGAGGQHINKTESAVRLTHLPTGIVVECQEERSQYKNRDKAMKMLRARLYAIKNKEQSDRIAAERKNQVGTGDRSERIRTYNFPQGRVTDHRIGLTVYTLDKFMNGDIGGMLDALRRAEYEKLASAEE